MNNKIVISHVSGRDDLLITVVDHNLVYHGEHYHLGRGTNITISTGDNVHYIISQKAPVLETRVVKGSYVDG